MLSLSGSLKTRINNETVQSNINLLVFADIITQQWFKLDKNSTFIGLHASLIKVKDVIWSHTDLFF